MDETLDQIDDSKAKDVPDSDKPAEKPEPILPLFEIEVKYLTEKSESLLPLAEDGPGYVVLRNETVVVPVVVVKEVIVEIEEDESNATKVVFLVLIICAFVFLLCVIAIVAYKNSCSKDKVTPSVNLPKTPGTIGSMINIHGKEKVSHINFLPTPNHEEIPL